jgi:glycosyltransferase involved in cell wall biosynthesis
MISVVIPGYREEAMGTLLDELEDALIQANLSLEIIVMDDGSTGNTAKIVVERQVKLLIQHLQNMGYGAPAIRTRIKNAINDLILIMGGSGSYSAKDYTGVIYEKEEGRFNENSHVKAI